MKKQLLFLGLAASVFSYSAKAQLALENFNHAGALPTGWTLVSDGHTVSTSFTGSAAIQDSLDHHAWWPVTIKSASDYSMITTSYFAPSATANRWLITPAFTVSSPYTVLQWDDDDLNSGEPVHILVSTTAGITPASFTTTLYDQPGGANAFVTHQLQLGAYNGTSITIAFLDDTTNNWGLALDNVQTTILPALDLGCTSLNMLPYTQTGSSITISGNEHNFGYNTVTTMHMNYSVNGGAAVSTALTGLTLGAGGDYSFSCTTPWVPSTAGIYTIKVWADNINTTGVDGNHTNDTMTATISVIGTLNPKRVLVEEFNQASCDPCAEATPNLDSVYVNNLASSIMVRYHVWFPGRDCMDSVTLSPFVETRASYYNVNGVPDAQVDGQYVYPGAGGFTSAVVASAASVKSPFTITVTPSYVWTTETFSYTATITAAGAVPAGLKAYAALTVDTLTYAANQSTESIAQTVFPEVAENMFPSVSGTTLTAFTTGSVQTVTGTWAKNHAWASDYSVWKYDSTLTGKIVVWVENDDVTYAGDIPYVYQAAFAPLTIGHVHNVGVNAVSGTSGSLDIYPNPASKTATVAVELTEDADVQLQVVNALGQVVLNMPSEHRNSGPSHSTIDVSNLAAGTYFVRVTVGSELLNKTLTITK